MSVPSILLARFPFESYVYVVVAPTDWPDRHSSGHRPPGSVAATVTSVAPARTVSWPDVCLYYSAHGIEKRGSLHNNSKASGSTGSTSTAPNMKLIQHESVSTMSECFAAV